MTSNTASKKARAEQQVFIEDFRRNAYQELVDTLAKRNAVREDLKKAELRRQLIVLTAPVDAVVLDTANRTVGSVVREAETLFVLVPQDVKLQAEVNVDGKDIGRVAVGQTVRIKFDAFPFQKHGTESGLSALSAGTHLRLIRRLILSTHVGTVLSRAHRH